MVTRPAHLADGLCKLIEAAGATAIRFPTVRIVASADTPQVVSLFKELDRFCALIFISRNAALCACKLLRRIGVALPQENVIAIGAKTARQLRQEGIPCKAPSQAAPSAEALIESGLLERIRDCEALIVRGQGGKESLAEHLRAQGARVTYAQVYRREKPRAVLSFDDAMSPPDVVLASSAESLRNLYQMTEDASRPRLLEVRVVVCSQSMVTVHEQIGFHKAPVIAASALDEDMWRATLRWCQGYAP